MTKFVFIAPNGQRLTRNSKTRTYTHAILHLRDGKWRIGSCIGRPDLVAARLEQWCKGSCESECLAVPAEAQP